MFFEQAYYTSCKTGLRGSQGFQMNAASKGLDSNTLDYLERCGGYSPPLSSPTKPSKEELEKFPLSLSFLKTNDGAGILCCSKYIGLDYSLRYGNYFTHFLYSKDISAFIKHLSPITAWGAAFWKETSIDKTELPLLELPDKGENPDLAGIKTFLDSDNRFDKFKAFTSCVQTALQTKKRLILVDKSESVAKWITSIAAALPDTLLEQLTFTTYNKNPYNTDALICGTTKDSDFRFSTAEVEHQYFVFDFENNRFSNPPPDNKFTCKLFEWYKNDMFSDVAQFKNFTDWLNMAWKIDDMDHLVDLYCLITNEEISETELLESVQYIIERKLYNVSEILIPVLSKLSESNINNRECNSLVKSLFQITYSSSETQNDLKDDILSFYIDWVIERILPEATEEILQNAANIFIENKIPKSAWNSSINSLIKIFENSRDLQWFSAVIDFTKSLDLLRELGPSIELMTDKVFLSDFRNKTSQNILGKLFEENLFPGLDEKIIKLVSRQLEIPTAAADLSHLLSRNGTLYRLKSLAFKRRDKLLYILISAFEVSGAIEKGSRSIAFFNDISGQFKISLSTNDYDKFFALAWYGKSISPEETYYFMNNLTNDILESSTFIELALKGLLHKKDILTLKEKDPVIGLINEFRKKENVIRAKLAGNSNLVNTYNNLAECLDLPFWCKRYKEIASIPHKLQLIKRALKILPSDNLPARGKVVETALFDYLTISGNSNESRNLLNELYEADNSLFGHSLNKILPQIESEETVCAFAWTQLFRFIHEKPEDLSKHSLIMEQTEKYVRKIYENFPDKNIKTIDQMFKSDKYWSQKWEEWKKEGSGLFKIKNKLFR
jgi:hypothetical protein